MRGEKPFGIFNRRVAISLDIFKIAALGVALLFLRLFSFQEVVMVWHPVRLAAFSL